MSHFYIAAFLLALMYVPSLFMLLLFSLLGFSLDKGTAEQVLVLLVLVAGWSKGFRRLTAPGLQAPLITSI